MTIETTPVNLLDGKPAGGEWLVQNLGTADIYLARTEDDCTTEDGVRISENEALSFDEPVRTRTGGGIWVRTASGEADVRVIRVG
jgi:hypothetical protein